MADGSKLTTEDVEMIARVIAEQAPRFVDRDTHHADHQWIQEKRVREEKLMGSKRRVIETLVGTIGTVGILGILAWVGHAIIDTLSKVML